MEPQELNAISFEDAIAISQQRHREITEELCQLRRELQNRDVVVSRLQSKLGAQCALELENRKLQQELRALKDGLARMLQQEPHLRDKLAAKTAAKAGDATATLDESLVSAVQALASSTKNYIARLPFEMQGDIFLNLDRFGLDRAGFACPQFRSVVSCLVGGSLRVIGRICLKVSKSMNRASNTGCDSPPSKRKRVLRRPTGLAGTSLGAAEDDVYDFHVSMTYSSSPMALTNGSMNETVSRRWSFSNTDAATSTFIDLLHHASVSDVMVNGPLPTRLLQALVTADVDASINRLGIDEFALKPVDLPVARSALTSFNSLRRLTLGNDVPLDLLTNDFLVALTRIGMVDFEFRSAVFYVRAEDDDDSLGGQDSRRILVNTYDGDYPDLDAGLMAFLFRGSEAQDEKLELKFPAARVPHDFCQRLLKAAMSDGSRSIVSLFFVAAIDDLTVKLEGFDEYASEPGEATIVYKVPQSSASDMLLELKISELADAPNGWKLVDFCRDKKPPPSMGAGGGGGGGWGGGSGFFDLLENGFGLFGNGGGWAGDNEYENDDE